jgi:hypothetical protein
MQSRLTLLIAEQHVADLHRAADHHRLVRAATAVSRSAPAARPLAAEPVTLMRAVSRTVAR